MWRGFWSRQTQTTQTTTCCWCASSSSGPSPHSTTTSFSTTRSCCCSTARRWRGQEPHTADNNLLRWTQTRFEADFVSPAGLQWSSCWRRWRVGFKPATLAHRTLLAIQCCEQLHECAWMSIFYWKIKTQTLVVALRGNKQQNERTSADFVPDVMLLL